jgi:hypothetical protein
VYELPSLLNYLFLFYQLGKDFWHPNQQLVTKAANILNSLLFELVLA